MTDVLEWKRRRMEARESLAVAELEGMLYKMRVWYRRDVCEERFQRIMEMLQVDCRGVLHDLVPELEMDILLDGLSLEEALERTMQRGRYYGVVRVEVEPIRKR